MLYFNHTQTERGIEMDQTEGLRRGMVAEINSQVQSTDPLTERERLEERQGRVWDTQELSRDFEVLGFRAPFVIVRRKRDNIKGTLIFQHDPRFYFSFVRD
jgi:hypothetical protein